MAKKNHAVATVTYYVPCQDENNFAFGIQGEYYGQNGYERKELRTASGEGGTTILTQIMQILLEAGKLVYSETARFGSSNLKSLGDNYFFKTDDKIACADTKLNKAFDKENERRAAVRNYLNLIVSKEPGLCEDSAFVKWYSENQPLPIQGLKGRIAVEAVAADPAGINERIVFASNVSALLLYHSFPPLATKICAGGRLARR